MLNITKLNSVLKYIIILLVISFTFFSCKSNKDKTNNSEPKTLSIVDKVITISGLLDIEESGRVVITEKPESKSRISYIIISDNSADLTNYNKHSVTANVKITKKISDWSYECELLKIE